MRLTNGADQQIGTINFKLSNYTLTVGATLGDAAGYATLDAAAAAALPLTAGVSRPAAAILERDGRFFAQALQGAWFVFTAKGSTEAPESFTLLEQLATSIFPGELRNVRLGTDGTHTFPTSSALRAIVDGIALLRVPTA